MKQRRTSTNSFVQDCHGHPNLVDLVHVQPRTPTDEVRRNERGGCSDSVQRPSVCGAAATLPHCLGRHLKTSLMMIIGSLKGNENKNIRSAVSEHLLLEEYDGRTEPWEGSLQICRGRSRSCEHDYARRWDSLNPAAILILSCISHSPLMGRPLVF
jgi:hypothetical protein